MVLNPTDNNRISSDSGVNAGTDAGGSGGTHTGESAVGRASGGEQVGTGSAASTGASAETNVAALTPLVEIRKVSFSYQSVSVLTSIDLSIYPADNLAIIGPNGSGKSTLIKLMLGIIKPTSGRITRFLQKELIGYVPQDFTQDMLFPGTVLEICKCYTKRIDSNIFERLGITSLLHEQFMRLSRGQQQRVLIAISILQKQKLLILDEPTAGIDATAKQSFYSLLHTINQQGVAIVLITHDIGVLPPHIEHVLCIHNKVCCWGKTQDLSSIVDVLYGPNIKHSHHY